MSRFLLIGLLAVLMAGSWGSSALAQRDAGAKSRGEFGKGFWDPSYRRSRRQSYYYQPARPSSEGYRSFSFEPIAVSPGDMVVVKGSDVQVMKGADVVGSVPKGLKFKVTKVVNGWLGAVVDVDGKNLRGWIWHKNVTRDDEAAPTTQGAPEGSQAQSYRRFSYAPAQPARSYRTYGRKREPWQYLKTDPRRYRP